MVSMVPPLSINRAEVPPAVYLDKAREDMVQCTVAAADPEVGYAHFFEFFRHGKDFIETAGCAHFNVIARRSYDRDRPG